MEDNIKWKWLLRVNHKFYCAKSNGNVLVVVDDVDDKATTVFAEKNVGENVGRQSDISIAFSDLSNSYLVHVSKLLSYSMSCFAIDL